MCPPSRMCGRQRRVIRMQAVHVRLDHRLLVLLARLRERVAAEAEAGVVDEDVEPAERSTAARRRSARSSPGRVRRGRARRSGLEPLDAARAAGDPRARLRERARGRRADPARGAGDDRRLALECGQGANLNRAAAPITGSDPVKNEPAANRLVSGDRPLTGSDPVQTTATGRGRAGAPSRPRAYGCARSAARRPCARASAPSRG